MALVSAWYGFSLVSILGHYLALRDPDAAVLHENALPVLARITETIDTAPSLPSGVHGVGPETSPAADPAMITIARRGIWDLTLATPSCRKHAVTPATKPTSSWRKSARRWPPSWRTATGAGRGRS